MFPVKIFPKPFAVANEVVKRLKVDNRRVADKPVDGGNDIFYLGPTDKLLDKFDGNIKHMLQNVLSLCEERFISEKKKRTIQKGEGVKVEHRIDKNTLNTLIPFIDAYLKESSSDYHNPNFNDKAIKVNLDVISDEYLVFHSDLVFIKDLASAKPYFKWFKKYDTGLNFELLQEFLIPYYSFLDFNCERYEDNVLYVTWHLSYTQVVLGTVQEIDQIIEKLLEDLSVDRKTVATVKEAIVKIRLGQDKFRKDLLSSDRSYCHFSNLIDEQILVASHVKPWSIAEPDERRDINNGILLSPMFDKLFDKFLLSFNSLGEPVLSKLISQNLKSYLLKTHPDWNTKLIIINERNKKYYEHHYNEFLKLERTL